MEKFVLFKLNLTKDFDFLLLNLSYESPTEYLDEILKLISSYNQLNVIFDNMLINGDGFNRYTSGKILNNKLDLSSFKIVEAKNLPSEVKNLVYTYFKNNPEKLDQGVLSDKQKADFLIKCQEYEIES